MLLILLNFIYNILFAATLASLPCATSALKSKTAKGTTALSNLPSRSLIANTLSKTACLSFTIHLRNHVVVVFSNCPFVKPGIKLPEK